MGLDSRMEFPSPGLPVEWMVEKTKQYISQGLTNREASELVALENVEYHGGNLSKEEEARKKAYLEKMGQTG